MQAVVRALLSSRVRGARRFPADLCCFRPARQGAPQSISRCFSATTVSDAAGDDTSQRERTRPRATRPLRIDVTIRYSQHCEAGVRRSVDVMEQRAMVLSVPTAVAGSRRQARRNKDTDTDGTVSEEALESLPRQPFPPEVTATLQARLPPEDVAAKPLGKLMPPVPYLPEIKYRRILNKAFGPGAWSLFPAGPAKVEGNMICRDYQMFVFGHLVSEARGKQEFFSKGKIMEDAAEGVKSNALMRCCKDLGVASELWDPDWVRKWQSLQQVRAAPRF